MEEKNKVMDMTIMLQMEMNRKLNIFLEIETETAKMSCIWRLFAKKEKHSDVRIQNPLYLNDIPDDIITLRAIEATIIDNLISIHYKIDEIKKKIAYEFQNGHSNSAKEALAWRAYLAERKRFFETRLARVQQKMQEIKESG